MQKKKVQQQNFEKVETENDQKQEDNKWVKIAHKQPGTTCMFTERGKPKKGRGTRRYPSKYLTEIGMDIRFKSQQCYYHTNGGCTKQDDCKYLHSDDEEVWSTKQARKEYIQALYDNLDEGERKFTLEEWIQSTEDGEIKQKKTKCRYNSSCKCITCGYAHNEKECEFADTLDFFCKNNLLPHHQ